MRKQEANKDDDRFWQRLMLPEEEWTGRGATGGFARPMLWIYGATVIRSRRRVSAPSYCGRSSRVTSLMRYEVKQHDFKMFEGDS
jgi:hypothetical protein